MPSHQSGFQRSEACLKASSELIRLQGGIDWANSNLKTPRQRHLIEV